jgi:glucuronyl/N-acetylglucosaminyl transferase EXT1
MVFGNLARLIQVCFWTFLFCSVYFTFYILTQTDTSLILTSSVIHLETSTTSESSPNSIRVVKLVNEQANSNLSYLTFQNDAFRPRALKSGNFSKCTMAQCFHFEKCQDVRDFRIYIHQEPTLITSSIYGHLIERIVKSKYATNNSDEACLFVLSLDTLDRDRISKNYLKNLDTLLKNLSYWREGQNFLLFNLYAGSWPHYRDTLDIDTSKAILAKASFSIKTYRQNFDISFPLFHSDLPVAHSTRQFNFQQIDTRKKYFLTFKGKRYLSGVGSETRNSLFHLNNNRDVILLTTCKHGVNWQELKDERCDVDNALYDKYDYSDLLVNSLFCLIPLVDVSPHIDF